MTARTSAALNTSPTTANFVLYAKRSVRLGSFDQVHAGDVGVAAVAAPSFGDQLLVGDHVQVAPTANLLSPSVTLGLKSQVGDVQTNALHNDGATSIGAVASYPSSMPPVPVAGNPAQAATDVSIGSHETQTLSPGAYGSLTIADHATVFLSAGTYSFASMTIADHVILMGDPAGVVVLVRGALSSAGWDQVAPGSSASADKLVILVSGSDGASSPVAVVGTHSQLTGLVAASQGTLAVGDHVELVGAFAAFDVALQDHTQVTLQSGFSPASTPAQRGLQQLSGYVTPTISSAPLVGPVPANTPIDFAIGLPLKDPVGLQNFIKDVSDPKSSQYRVYVTGPADFATRFGPSSSDYQNLQDFARGAGLTLEDKFTNNLLLRVFAPVETVARTFYTSFSIRLRPDGTQFYAIDSEPSLDFSIPILRVSGFDNFDVAKPSAGGSGTNALYNLAGEFQGNDFRNAYLGNPPPSPLMNLKGGGVQGGPPQHVGLFELDPLYLNDISAYLGLTGGPTVQFNLINYSPGFGTFTSGSKQPNGQQEVTGDVEVVTAIAPEATIDFYYVPNGSGSGSYNTVLNVMADCPDLPQIIPGQHGCGLPLANQLSTSWNTTPDDNTAQVIQEFAAQGQTFFVTAGDFGAYSNSNPLLDIRFTASPYATIVGGTLMTMSGNGSSYVSETTWNDGNGAGGGGILNFPFALNSFSQPKPDWQPCQSGSQSGCSTQYRNVPDVSAVADGIVGCFGSAPFLSQPITCQNYFGTSFAAPLWAGFTALINQQGQINSVPPVGFLNPALYEISQTVQYQTAFNDIQDGSNNNGFTAVAGYDLATGLGSPRWPLIYALVGGSTPPPPPDGGIASGSVTIGMQEAMFGENVCVSAGAQSGWLAGYRISTAFEGIPGYPNPISGTSVATVNPDGSFNLRDSEVAELQTCTTNQIFNDIVTIVISETSPVTGAVVGGTTTTVPASLWCANTQLKTWGAGCP
jgi:hypothetical protein